MNASTFFDKNIHTDKEKNRVIRAKIHSIYTILGNKIQKKDNIYLFIGRSGGEFTGNVKYLFLYFLENIPSITAYFLTQHRHVFHELKRANLPALFYPTEQAIYTSASAGTVIIDSISFRNHEYYPLIANSRQVQLWHGVGNKKIGFQLQGASCLQGRDQTLIEDHSNYDVFISTSPFYTEEVFRKSIGAKSFLPLGYPRTDIFFQSPTKKTLIGCDVTSYSSVVKARKKGPVILFAPTFRDYNTNPLTQNILNIDSFFSFLIKHNAHLIIKLHTRTPITKCKTPENITICESSSDIYPFMPLADILITDYSSIFTDYLLLNRPVIFFWSDFETYMQKDRGFQFPFEEMCPGHKCKTESELKETILDIIHGKDDWESQRKILRDKSFLHTCGGACERIATYLLQNNES